MSNYIIVTGGVVSSVGKGIVSASIGSLLEESGYSIDIRKIDPYINIDAGTMNPYRHGEVYVTSDGTETDLDLGNYERFTKIKTKYNNIITTGRVYFNVMTKERQGEYLGRDLQVIPHITDEIKAFISRDSDKYDFIICEIGGTIGDIEIMPFIESVRQLSNDVVSNRVFYIHVVWIPYINAARELKTKPAQHSVRSLLSAGVQPNTLVCRSNHEVNDQIKEKLALFCNMPKEAVISLEDQDTIYRVPTVLHNEELDKQIKQYFNLEQIQQTSLDKWHKITANIDKNKNSCIKIGICGKYDNFSEAYKSLNESIYLASLYNNTSLELIWINTNMEMNLDQDLDGIIIPGAFGERGMKGKIDAITYARNNDIPILGICCGMQLMIIEAFRNIGYKDADSSEFRNTIMPVITPLSEYYKDRKDINKTMRLGNVEFKIIPNTMAHRIYNADTAIERHRHKYIFNPDYTDILSKTGLICSAFSMHDQSVEIIEHTDKKYFIGVQYHPEFSSTVESPSPIFIDFCRTCKEYRLSKINTTKTTNI